MQENNNVEPKLSKAEMIAEIISMRESYAPHTDIFDLHDWLIDQDVRTVRGVYYKDKRKMEKMNESSNQMSSQMIIQMSIDDLINAKSRTSLENEYLFLSSLGYVIEQLPVPSTDQYGRPIPDSRRMEIAEENQLKLERIYRGISN